MFARYPTIIYLLLFGLQFALASEPSAADDLSIELVETRRIWDQAPHNAFTDLVRWKGKFYCAFREGQGHAGDVGNLRVIVSRDGQDWESVGLLSLEEYDLRDASLSITPDDRLMVLGGAQQNREGKRTTGTFVSFSTDGKTFDSPKIVIPSGRWLWRVTWFGDTGYGVSYGTNENRSSSALLKTTDGVNYETVTDALVAEDGWPTEARIRFDAAGKAYCLHRRDGPGDKAYFGTSSPPYTDWNWHDTGKKVGGPNFLTLPNGVMLGAGRLYEGGARTELFQIDRDTGQLTPLLRLPSGGDTSYPGMVWHDDMLWLSYYSSHEGKANIYLAKIRFPKKRLPIEIGNRIELFVDRHLIDTMKGTRLQLHHPTPAETVLKFDLPWEGAFCGYVTVLRDGDKFRMYYRGSPRVGGDLTDREVTCYAESRDGVNWIKPVVGIYEYNESCCNNIVLKGQAPANHNFSPFLDTNPNAMPAQRFKALGGSKDGLIAFASHDGFNWIRLQAEPVFTEGVFDSQNVSFYSTAEKQYVCYFRTWTRQGNRGFRSISRTTSDDFVHWSDPVEMSFGDTPFEHLYTNQTAPYYRAPHIGIAVAARFMPGRKVLTEQDAESIGVDPRYFGDCSDVVFMSTRGGNRYQRTFMESFVRPGPGIENWVSRTNYPALGIHPTSDTELSIYIQKNYGQPSAALQRYTLRIDGFVSVNGGYAGGEMVTKAVVFPVAKPTEDPPVTLTSDRLRCDVGGSIVVRQAKENRESEPAAAQNAKPALKSEQGLELHLNCSTSAAGSIRVELQDADGNPILGFTRTDCDLLIGDRIDHVVSWTGNSNLNSLAGRPVRFCFILKDADLYSMQIR